MRDSYGSSNRDYSYPPENEKRGVVANTKKLNIRESPSLSAKIVSIAAEGDSVYIDTEFYDLTFYKVKLDNGVRGYCVKLYVNLTQ